MNWTKNEWKERRAVVDVVLRHVMVFAYSTLCDGIRLSPHI